MNAPKKKPSSAAGGKSGPSAAAGTRRAGSTAPLRIYKPGQGATVRWGSAAGAGIMSVAAGNFLFQWLQLMQNEKVRYLVPVALMGALFYLIYRLIGRNETVVNFMIATEGEMKKVNWSSRREVTGATKVVIVTTLSLGAILFFVDIIFMLFFSSIDVLQINLLGQLFGGGEGSS